MLAFLLAAAATAAAAATIERTPVHGLAFSPDGRHIAAAGSDGRVRVFELAAPASAPLLIDGHEGSVLALAYSPDGRFLATGGRDDVVRLWEAGTGKPGPVLRGHERWVNALAWSPDGRTLASGGADRSLRLWDPASGRALRVIDQAHADWVNALAWSADGRLLASGGADNRLAVWDAGSWRRRAFVEAHARWVSAAAWTRGGLNTTSLDGSVRLWDARGKALKTLHQGEAWVLALSASPDGRRLAAASFDGRVRLWLDGSESELPGRLPWTAELAWSPDGRRLAVGSRFESELQVWDAATLTRTARFKLPSPGAALVNSLVFSSGTLAASQDGGQVTLWEPASGRLLASTRPYQESADAAAVLPGALLVAGHGRPMLLLDPQGGLLAKGPRAELLALAPNARSLAVAVPGELRLLRLPELVELARSTFPRGEVHGLAFDTTGSRLALAWSRGLLFWEPATGHLSERPGGGARKLAFLNKDLLVAAGRDFRLLGAGGGERVLEPERVLPPQFTGFEPRCMVAAAGTLLALGWVDRSVSLYDVSDPEHPRLLERLTLGPGRVTPSVDRLTALGLLADGTLAGGSVDGVLWLRQGGRTRELRAPPTPALHP